MSKQSAAGTLDAGPVRVHAFTREYVRARSALFKATVSTRPATAQERLTTMPTIQLFAEHNVREGFITPADFETLLATLPEHLQDFTRFAFLTGWRRASYRHWRGPTWTASAAS